MAPVGRATRAAGGESWCDCDVDDRGGEGGNRTPGPDGLDLISAAGYGCLLEHGHIQPNGQPAPDSAGHIQPNGRHEQRRIRDAATDPDSQPDPQPNGEPAPDGAGYGEAWPEDDPGSRGPGCGSSR